MTELVERSAAVVRRYGGTVDKFTGDGIMAVFGAPTALEDHAFRRVPAQPGRCRDHPVQEGHSICHILDLGPSGGGYVPDMADRMAEAFHQWLTDQ